MDWNSINWEYLGLVAVLAILVGGFVGGAVYLVTRQLDTRRARRWDRELNGDYAPADIVDLPKQREADGS